MKELYTKPVVSVESFDTADVVTTSMTIDWSDGGED